VAFFRRHPSGDVLVIHNVSRRTTTVDLPPEAGAFRLPVWSPHPGAVPEDGRLKLPPFSSVVLGP
jgi:hypothetical protein